MHFSLAHFIKSTAVRYAVVGVCNTVVGLSIIYALKYFFEFGDAIANFFGYAIALCGGYALNSRWTFNYAGSDVSAVIKYLIVLAIAYACNFITVLTAIHQFRVDGYYAQPLGILPYTVVGYLGSRFFAFAQTCGTSAARE
jgi:putative flippase GtrA